MTTSKLFARECGLRPLIKRHWAIVLLCILAIAAHADNHMRVTIKDGVTTNPMHDTLSIGGAGGVEIGYRWQYQKRWLIDVGLGLGYGIIVNHFPDSISNEQRADYQGDTYIAKQQFTQLHNQLNALTLTLPIMAGYEYRRFYAMASVQLQGVIPTSLATKAILTQTFEYDKLIDPLNQKSQSPYSRTKQIIPSFDIQVCTEIGIQLSDGFKYRNYRSGLRTTYLSVFVDYSVYATRPTFPLTIGAKLTWLLQMYRTRDYLNY